MGGEGARGELAGPFRGLDGSLGATGLGWPWLW